MKLTHNIQNFLPRLLMVMLGWMCFSCSEDVSEQGGDLNGLPQGAVTVKVVTRDLATATRSLSRAGQPSGTFAGSATDNELIHSCVVVFVNTDGKVAKVKTLPAESQNGVETGVDIKEFTVILESGNYQVYAFANISQDALKNLDLNGGGTINLGTENQTLTITDIEESLFDVNATALTQTSHIPMSGYLTGIEITASNGVKINGTATSEVTIPVVRMVGKIEFQFTNNSTNTINIKEISFKPGATGKVKLLPTWEAGSEAAEESANSDASKKLSLPDMGLTGVTVGSEIKRSYTDMVIGTGVTTKEKSCALYVREVVSNHPTTCFPITIKYTVGNSGTGEGAVATEENVQEMTALLYDLNYINRNDWIRVPITLTDRKLSLDVVFYPPIGGYPPVTQEEKEDEYYVTFATGGYFSINTLVTDKANGSTVNPKYVSVSIPQNGISNTSFFRKQPSVDAITGELVGEIYSGLNSGDSSIVTIEVNLTEKDNNDNLITSEKFLRKIHFIYTPPTTNNNTND